MQGPIRVSSFLFMAIVLCAGSTLAQANSKNHVFSCKKPQEFGLYEQCEEVTFLGNIGDLVRVYSKATKRVITLPAANLLVGQPVVPKEKLSKVFVPANFLWNTSLKNFAAICQVSSGSQHQLDVNCGRYQKVRIPREQVLVLRPYSSVESIAYSKK